jgi:hypothetical protein
MISARRATIAVSGVGMIKVTGCVLFAPVAQHIQSAGALLPPGWRES